MRRLAILLAALFFLALSPVGAETGRFLHVSDIHFDPFEPPDLPRRLAGADPTEWPAILAALTDQAPSRYGRDTNAALLASALAALREAAAEADFAILSGDLLSHRFEERAAQALGATERSDAVEGFAVRTTLHVAEALAAAMPGKPVFVSLGNNDSACGDYRIEPGGGYLAATLETVRRLAGAERVEPDFETTYAAAGYYAARHPTAPEALVIVLNDVLWSTEYLDVCGGSGTAAGDTMLRWLEDRLERQRAAGGRVWLVRHIPLGIDTYATLHATAASCPAKVRPFLKEPFASAFAALLSAYADILQASFAGHTHFDDYRLVTNPMGRALAVEKIAPGISPIFGQNPGFHRFSYDPATGGLQDFETYGLSNLAAASTSGEARWRLEYRFTQAYGLPGFSPDAVAALVEAMRTEGPARQTFDRFYDVGRGDFDPVSFPAHACAIVHADAAGFTDCFCAN